MIPILYFGKIEPLAGVSIIEPKLWRLCDSYAYIYQVKPIYLLSEDRLVVIFFFFFALQRAYIIHYAAKRKTNFSL